MKVHYQLILIPALLLSAPLMANSLKYLVYDFEGYIAGDAVTQEGGFGYADVTSTIVANPISGGDYIGNRVAEISLTHADGYGGVGRWVGHTIEMDATADYFNFFFYNPSSRTINLTVVIQDDDDGTPTPEFDAADDDRFVANVRLPVNSGWELLSIPLSDFEDVPDHLDQNGGDGIFNIGYTHGSGLAAVVFEIGVEAGDVNETFYLDYWSFSEGPLATNGLDYPVQDDFGNVALGAFTTTGGTGNPAGMPGEMQNLFPADGRNHWCFTNHFIAWGEWGDDANAVALPGEEIQEIIDRGFVPQITWEPMFLEYDRLDAVQPTLAEILAGDYDTYINTFADKIASYDGLVQLRFMHEMDGDFYPWCVSVNGYDAQLYNDTWKKVVDMFDARGATNVEWMWCVNALSLPQRPDNWLVNYYPGDDYVDVVAVDVYNHPNVDPLPTWRSLAYEGGHHIYYLTKYFSHKPLYFAEIGCRERYTDQEGDDASKAEWVTDAAKMLKSHYDQFDAVIWFHTNKEHDWRINSSEAATEAFKLAFYDDEYFGCEGAVISSGSFPVDFETSWMSFQGFGGSDFARVDNPHKDADNGSEKVGLSNSGADIWAGIFSEQLSSKLTFAGDETFTMKVWAEKAAKVTLKLEDWEDSEINWAQQLTIPVTNQWVELEFDLSNATSDAYDKVVIFFDIEAEDEHAYYFDDLTIHGNLFTAVPELTATSSPVYPNPSSGQLAIENGTITKVSTALGQVVFTGDRASLDLTDLPTGQYTVELRSDGKLHYTNWLKQ